MPFALFASYWSMFKKTYSESEAISSIKSKRKFRGESRRRFQMKQKTIEKSTKNKKFITITTKTSS